MTPLARGHDNSPVLTNVTISPSLRTHCSPLRGTHRSSLGVFRNIGYLQGREIVCYRDRTYMRHVGPNSGAIEQMLPIRSGSSLRQIFSEQYSLAPNP